MKKRLFRGDVYSEYIDNLADPVICRKAACDRFKVRSREIILEWEAEPFDGADLISLVKVGRWDWLVLDDSWSRGYKPVYRAFGELLGEGDWYIRVTEA